MQDLLYLHRFQYVLECSLVLLPGESGIYLIPGQAHNQIHLSIVLSQRSSPQQNKLFERQIIELWMGWVMVFSANF